MRGQQCQKPHRPSARLQLLAPAVEPNAKTRLLNNAAGIDRVHLSQAWSHVPSMQQHQGASQPAAHAGSQMWHQQAHHGPMHALPAALAHGGNSLNDHQMALLTDQGHAQQARRHGCISSHHDIAVATEVFGVAVHYTPRYAGLCSGRHDDAGA